MEVVRLVVSTNSAAGDPKQEVQPGPRRIARLQIQDITLVPLKVVPGRVRPCYSASFVLEEALILDVGAAPAPIRYWGAGRISQPSKSSSWESGGGGSTLVPYCVTT